MLFVVIISTEEIVTRLINLRIRSWNPSKYRSPCEGLCNIRQLNDRLDKGIHRYIPR